MPEHFITTLATPRDFVYLEDIIQEINKSAQERKTGIVDRTVGYLKRKINEGFGIMTIDTITREWAGFSCLEVWNHDKYVSNTGLIIKPKYRGKGLLKGLKSKVIEVAQKDFPDAKVFSLSSNKSVIRVNEELGYKRVSFSEVMNDPDFNQGFESEVDYYKLMQKGFNAEGKYVAMILDLSKQL